MKDIKFKKVYMKNFKCHEELEFDFSINKLIFITGNNGKGKSSIIDAVTFALYDQTTKGVKGDDVIRKRSKKNCEILLTFSIGADEYRVETYRQHDKHGTTKLIFKNNVDITDIEVKDSKEYLKNLIMPFDVFINCVLFSQYVSKSFMELKQSGRKEILDNMLGLTQYEEHYEKFKNKLKELLEKELKLNTDKQRCIDLFNNTNKLLETYKQNLDKIKLELTEKYNNIENDIKESNKVIKELSKNYNESAHLAYKHDKEDIQNDISKLIQKYDSLKNLCANELSVSLKQYNSDLEKLIQEFELNKLKKTKDINEEKISIEKELLNIQSNLKEEISETEKKFKEELYDYDKKVSEEINDICSKLNLSKKEYENTQENIKKLERQLKEINANIEQYDNMLNKKNPECPTCGQEIRNESKEKVIEKKKEYLSSKTNIEKEIKIYNTKLDDIKIEGTEYVSLKEKKLEKKTEKINNINIKKSEALDKVNEKYSKKIEKASKKVSLLEDKISKIINKLSEELSSNKDILKESSESLQEEIKFKYKIEAEELMSDRTEKSEKLNDINIKLKEYEELFKEIENKQNRNIYLKEKLVECTEELKTFAKNTIDEVEKYEKEMNKYSTQTEEIEKEIVKNNKNIEIIKFWKNGFSDSGIKGVILDESIPILNKRAKELCEMVNDINVRFDSQKTLKSGDLRNSFTVNAIQSKNLSGFEEFSAGETRMVNLITLLCLRHLLEKMNNINLNILLMDECLDSLDSSNSVVVTEMLKKLSQEYCILLISHTLRDCVEADEYLSF